MIRGSGCSKSRLPKAAGAEVAVQPRNALFQLQMSKNATSRWREVHLQVKMYKMPQLRHAAVARSTFASQNAKKLTGSDVEKWQATVLRKMCKTPAFWHALELTMWKRCLAEEIKKVDTQSVNESISQLVNQSGSQLVPLVSWLIGQLVS